MNVTDVHSWGKLQLVFPGWELKPKCVRMLKPKFRLVRHVSTRLDTSRHVRRVELVASSVSSRAVRRARHSRMHGLDTSNVSSRDVTS